jgi:hypothetical protein
MSFLAEDYAAATARRQGGGSKPQDRLGHDVALDLVGAGIDRAGAVVEVFGRGDPGVGRAGQEAVGGGRKARGRAAEGAAVRLPGGGVDASGLDGQLGQALAELGGDRPKTPGLRNGQPAITGFSLTEGGEVSPCALLGSKPRTAASCSRRVPMIWQSVNLNRFIARPLPGASGTSASAL